MRSFFYTTDRAALLKQLEGLTQEEMENQVYRRFVFDLCPACQRKYLSDPLRTRRPVWGHDLSCPAGP